MSRTYAHAVTRDQAVTVTAGSRLHFGMFSFGQPDMPQFGGVGTMIDSPAVRVRVTHAGELSASGSMHDRALDVARRVAQAWDEPDELRCAIEVLESPRQHIGLGSGTQLALAVTQALHVLYNRTPPGPEALSRQAGRGRRSAIGVHGFLQGGLLWERGKLSADELSPLLSRVELPSAWRWVLVYPRGDQGLSGPQEQRAFDLLPPVPRELTRALLAEAADRLFPAAARGDFEEFSNSLFRFGQLAGRCFQSQQAGLYATQQAIELVELLRSRGIVGVSQTSWGPTIFALMAEEEAAQSLSAWLTRELSREVEVIVARPLNRGAAIDLF